MRRSGAEAARRGLAAPGVSRAIKEAAEVQTEQAIGAWKWPIRKRMLERVKEMDMLKRRARNIPRFKCAENAAEQIGKLPAFQSAACVLVQKGAPLGPVRTLALKQKKQLLLPCVGDYPFFRLDPAAMKKVELEKACKSEHEDLLKVSEPLGLDSKFKVDLVVVGCVAVDPSSGARLGMGEGAADLEYGLLRYMGAVDDLTLVVATVDDKQLVKDFPSDKMEVYDVPVDIICTPTQTIYTKPTSSKPTGIYWNRLSPEKLSHFTVLRALRRRIAAETQTTVKLAPLGQKLYHVPDPVVKGPAVFITDISPGVTEAELKTHLKQAGVAATSLSLYRSRNMWTPCALVGVAEGSDLKEQVSIINKSDRLKDWKLKAKAHHEGKVTGFRALQKMLRSSL